VLCVGRVAHVFLSAGISLDDRTPS